jgi:threonine/homoserine/homoserine lactone efflux protein
LQAAAGRHRTAAPAAVRKFFSFSLRLRNIAGRVGWTMELLLLGAGLGVVGGIFPSPLHLIALSQVALNRWLRALMVLVGVPLLVDGVLLLITFFFYQHIPRQWAHDVAYVGGVVVSSFAIYALIESRGKKQEERAESHRLTYAGVSAAALAEVAAPGTWIYWLTIAGPIISEGRSQGYWHIVPFFAGSLLGYYGAAVLALWLMAWGAGLHKAFQRSLFTIANVLLLVLGISYLIRAYLRK